jgi:hypothetical protein
MEVLMSDKDIYLKSLNKWLITSGISCGITSLAIFSGIIYELIKPSYFGMPIWGWATTGGLVLALSYFTYHCYKAVKQINNSPCSDQSIYLVAKTTKMLSIFPIILVFLLIIGITAPA